MSLIDALEHSKACLILTAQTRSPHPTPQVVELERRLRIRLAPRVMRFSPGLAGVVRSSALQSVDVRHGSKTSSAVRAQAGEK
jgi:hypothetical protein